MIEAEFRGRLGGFSLDAAFEAPMRGVTALFGPSGCGKTTILRCVAGLQRLDGRLRVGGEVWQEGRAFREPHRRPVGYVFQEASLFPHRTVRGNLLYGFERAMRGGTSRPRSPSTRSAISSASGASSIDRRSICRAESASASRSAARSFRSRASS